MIKNKINFTVGPVQMDINIRDVGKNQIPYFRTNEFSDLMLENELLIKKMSNATENHKVVFITGSGTASMEASVCNTLSQNDKVLIVNGGSFGQRFVELCDIYEIKYEQIKLEYGQPLTKDKLEMYDGKDYTAFIINMHETSTGTLYDMNLVSDFCKKNNLFLIVDAISSFLADHIDIKRMNIDVMITGSQKALACPPGISIIVLSEKALVRINNANIKCMYLNLKLALDNAKRGQTPFTPAVGILLQLNKRLKNIELSGGIEYEKKRIQKLSSDFRKKIKNLPFKIFSSSCSNAVTALEPLNVSAYSIFETLKNEYDIWVCPNGGNLKEKVFRVGHIGDLTVSDNNKLIDALNDMNKRNLL